MQAMQQLHGEVDMMRIDANSWSQLQQNPPVHRFPGLATGVQLVRKDDSCCIADSSLSRGICPTFCSPEVRTSMAICKNTCGWSASEIIAHTVPTTSAFKSYCRVRISCLEKELCLHNTIVIYCWELLKAGLRVEKFQVLDDPLWEHFNHPSLSPEPGTSQLYFWPFNSHIALSCEHGLWWDWWDSLLEQVTSSSCSFQRYSAQE